MCPDMSCPPLHLPPAALHVKEVDSVDSWTLSLMSDMFLTEEGGASQCPPVIVKLRSIKAGPKNHCVTRIHEMVTSA